MRKFALALSAALSLSLAACGGGDKGGETASALPAVAAPEGKQWVDIAGKTTSGGYEIGNPDAKVQFVEYGAITCPGCAVFSVQSHDELMQMVNTGKVSFEYRPFMVHGVQDLPGFLLAQCNGPAGFVALSHQMYAEQESWLGNLQKLTPQEQTELGKLKDPLQLSSALADKYGLVEFVKQRGVSQDAAKACLADSKTAQELIKTTETAQKATGDQAITGTPTFFINGKRLDAGSWEQVKVQLRNAGVRD